MQSKILKGLNYETLDRQVIGDVKRVSRVPYTVHETSKLLCTPITLEHHPAIIQTLQPFRENGLDNSLLDLVLREKKKQVRRIFEKNEKIRPCIEVAVKKLLEGNGGHLMRLAIATEELLLQISEKKQRNKRR